MANPVKPKPDGFHTVTPYLLVAEVEPVIEFLRDAFDARLREPIDRIDGKIRHAQLVIGDSALMLGRVREGGSPMPSMLYVYVDECDQSYRRALAAGATSIMPPADQFYGDRSAGVRDPSGNQWWLATHIEDVSPEEHRARAAAH